jgi:hypothetical protein
MHDHDVLLRLAILTPTTGDPDMIGWLTGLAGVDDAGCQAKDTATAAIGM